MPLIEIMARIEIKNNEKAAYINGGGARCLICNSMDLEGGQYNGDDNFITQKIVCLECGSSWQDVYVLTDVDDIETSKTAADYLSR